MSLTEKEDVRCSDDNTYGLVTGEVKNILTIDVEDWFHTNDFNIRKEDWSRYESRIRRNTEKVLEILDEYDVKATFFVLGGVAESEPGVIRSIIEAGHEIGSHGSYHEMADRMKPELFREDVRRSCRSIEDITGVKVIEFRAPSWSIGPGNIWALEVLEEEGIKVDSSFQPFKTFLSGNSKLPMHPFHPVIEGRRLDLIEFPSTIIGFLGLRMPFSGGAYLRMLPESFIIWAFRMVTRKRPGMIYIHPWELDTEQPHIESEFPFNISHYKNLDTTERKMRRLLKEFDFHSLSVAVQNDGFPDIVIKAQYP
ncbi:MAG: polysaccharide deacetylase family protein [Saccharofermentanales bacterium]